MRGFVAALATIGIAGASQAEPYTTPTGVALLRPVDAALRTEQGFPPPRDPEVVLTEIDEINVEFAQIMSSLLDEHVEPSRARLYELRSQRINLASELEESGYDGDRLEDILMQKAHDIGLVWQDLYQPVNWASSQWWDLKAKHEGEPPALAAQRSEYVQILSFMNHHQMLVSERDLERIAELEFVSAGQIDAGGLLSMALISQDAATRQRWQRWMIENLPETSRGARQALAAMGFGSPIRLQGVDFDGSPIDTAKWLGDVVLVDFWGSWCGPCIDEAPNLQELLETHAQDGLRVLGVLCDADPEAARELKRVHGWQWPELVDPRTEQGIGVWRHPLAVEFGIDSYPTIWLIDRNGVLRMRGGRGEVLADQVDALLAEPLVDAP